MTSFNNTDRIVLVGNGWGAVSACKGLQSASFKVQLLSADSELEALGAEVLTASSMDSLTDAVIVFAGYKRIVPVQVLQRNICINVHYSLLPKYRGFHSTVWAILNDEPDLGLTVHLMNEFIDDGPILAQYRVKNDLVSSSVHYMECFNAYIASHLGQIIREFLNGTLTPVVQDKSAASWVGKRNLEDCRIDFGRSVQYLKAFFRALVPPYPLPFFELNGERYYVKDARFFLSPVKTHLGRILNIDEEGLWIKVGDGYLIVSELLDKDSNMVDIGHFKIGQFLNV